MNMMNKTDMEKGSTALWGKVNNVVCNIRQEVVTTLKVDNKLELRTGEEVVHTFKRRLKILSASLRKRIINFVLSG